MTAFAWVAASAPLPGFVIRATVVLAMGIALAWLMRKRSAQVRHRLWPATLLVVLLLPALAFWAPRWEVPLLPVAAHPAAAPADVGLTGPSAAERSAAPASEAARTAPLGSDIALTALDSPDLDETARAAALERGPGPATAHASEPAALRAGGPIAASGPRAQLLLFWAIGCLGGLASLAAGHLRFHTLVRRARPLDDPLWIRDMRAIGSRLGIRRDVRLVVSEAAGTPMTGGFRKPVILLPASSAAWGPGRRWVVLMHELVHVRRRDALRQLLSGVVLALYWFHPLGWIACRLAAASREEACDERVLELGWRPSVYARHLISLATGTTSARLPVAALSMARQSSSRLEKRIMAILRPRRPRTSALVSGAVLTVTGLLGLSAAIAHPVPREQAGAHVTRADASVIQIGQPSSREIDVENPAASVAAPDGQLEAMASASMAAETVESAGGEAAEGGIEDAGNSEPPALRPLDLQEVNCYPPSTGRLDPIAFHVRTVPIGIMREGEDRFAGMSRDGVRLCMRLHGDVELGPGGVRSIAADGWILLESDGEKLHRLTLRPGDAGLEHEWTVGGESRPFDELTREWRDGMLAVLRGLLEIDRIRGEESELEDRISGLLGTAPGLEDRASRDRGIVEGLQSQVAYRQSVVADLLDRISYHQGVLSAMRDEIAYHRSVVSGMRDEIAMHRGRVAAFQKVKSSHEARITALIPRLETADSVTREAIDRSIKGWEERIKEIDGQIEAYGLQGKVRKIEAGIRDYGVGGMVQTLEQRISAYELSAGFRQIEAAIEEETARLDDVTRRTEQAIRARDSRIGDTGQETAVSTSQGAEVARLDEVARLEQQLRDLDADDGVEFWGQVVEDTAEQLLELIRRL
ncbi:MAG: hypothetical protein F4187_10885 [Gemmatimonadetes bacterium]|nr:hypothetical protein [Gemmatimonadota bacterium]